MGIETKGRRNLLATTSLVLGVLSMPAWAELPEGWIPVGSDHSAYDVVFAEDAGEAGPGFRIRSEEGASGFGGIGQSISAKNYLGERVAWSGRLRTRDVSGWTGLWMRVDGEGGEVLAFDNMQSRPVSGNTDWESHSVVLDVPEEAQSIVFGVLLAGEGQVNIDQVDLDVADEEEESTEERSLTPRNLDF